MRNIILAICLFLSVGVSSTMAADNSTSNQLGSLREWSEGAGAVLSLGRNEERAAYFMYNTEQQQGFILVSHPWLSNVAKVGDPVVLKIYGELERDNYDGTPNSSMWHGEVIESQGAKLVMAPVSVVESLFRVIEDEMIMIDLSISKTDGSNTILTNAYFIGNKQLDPKYDLPFKIFMSNASKLMK